MMMDSNAITIARSENSALMMRRAMIRIPAVLDALEPVEKAVLIASTEKTIAEYSSAELATELNTALKWISKDIGYRVTDESDRQYLVIRSAEILKRYYSNFTLKDFRMAFEMSLTGELDDFLPRGRDGQPDRNHYQQFNADYLCKILNAYKGRRGWILKKANDAMPFERQLPDADAQRCARNNTRKELIETYYHFKYRGYMPQLFPIAEMLYYNYLASVGLADEMTVTLADKQKVLQQTISMFLSSGRIGEVRRLKSEGISAKDLEHGTTILARRKALKRTFEWMVRNEIQITDYIKFE